MKKIVSLHGCNIDDNTAGDAPKARAWGENISRNMSNKYTREGIFATLVFEKSIFLQKYGGFENCTCARDLRHNTKRQKLAWDIYALGYEAGLASETCVT